MATPNLGLILPVVGPGGTLSPVWASMVNAALSKIDSHDHSGPPNGGALVSSAGLNVVQDFPFNSFNATLARSLRFTSQSSVFTLAPDIGAVYVVNGDLYYRNLAGQNVQVTSGLSVAGPYGNITGLVAPASAMFFGDTFAFQYDAGLPARISVSNIQLYHLTELGASPITLAAPAGVSAYAWTLPAAQNTQTNVVSISNAGVVTYGLVDGSAATPGLSFTAATTTGLFRDATKGLGITRAGTASAYFRAGRNYAAGTGSMALPAWSFDPNPDAGAYIDATAGMGLVYAGVASLYLKDGRTYSGGTGTEALPSFAFVSNPDTGMYLAGGLVSLASAGVQRLLLTTNGALTQDGTQALPGFSFLAQASTGWYRPSNTEMRATVNGLDAFGMINPAGGVSQLLSYNDGGVNFPVYSFDEESDLGFGRVSANVAGIANGGAWIAQFSDAGISTGSTFVKWAKLTVTNLTAGNDSAVISVSGATQVLGVTGRWGTHLNPQGRTITDTVAAGVVNFKNPADSSAATSVQITNSNGAAIDATMIVFYI